VRDHDDIDTVEFTLDLAGFDRAAGHEAGAAGPTMGLGDALDSGQAALGQAGAEAACLRRPLTLPSTPPHENHARDHGHQDHGGPPDSGQRKPSIRSYLS
jgi:hypothetical protein